MTQGQNVTAALFAAAFLAACGGGSNDSGSTPQTAAPDEDAVTDAMNSVEETVNEAMDDVAGSMSNMQDDAGDMIDAVQDEVEDLANDAADSAQDMMDGAADSAGQMMDDAADAAQGLMNDAADTVDDAVAGAGAMADAVMPATAPADDGNPCTISITVGDNIAYSESSVSVPSSCGTVTVTLTHLGQLPAVAMGHNWVLLPEDAVDAVATAGMSVGLDADYLPDDDRIVAATGIIGGGESDDVAFELDDLTPGTNYVYVCTFPGHWSIMKGTFSVDG